MKGRKSNHKKSAIPEISEGAREVSERLGAFQYSEIGDESDGVAVE
ncbi:MAG: hypothetical protein V2I33_19000 [Kangiellaceae bacterium]|nr:hypothetical protein [Kangiellaceae bacterium]